MLLGVSGILLVNPDESLKTLEGLRRFMTADLGWLFLGFVFLGTIWLGWLALSRHGDLVLGDPEKGPDYSNISWFGMLFCAGIGSNLLYFGTMEWTGYYLTPPPIAGVAAGTPVAADWAGAYSFFHWGIGAWATYAMATIPIAYMLHVRRSTTLRVSTACDQIPGLKTEGPLGKIIDILFIFGLVSGVATSLGIGIPMISAVASDLTGIERGMALDTGILVGLTICFSLSVSAGLDKGIKRLSDINMVLAILLLGFILFAGPTSFIMNQAFDSLALMFQNFIEMSLRTDAGSEASFAQDNTIFFWAWWMAWAPFMGLFIARISGGRTIRQVIVGVVIGGSLACWAGFAILGHTTMALAQSGSGGFNALLATAAMPTTVVGGPQVVIEILHSLPFSGVNSEMLAQSGSEGFSALVASAQETFKMDGPQAVVELLHSLPFSGLVSGIFFVLSFIFVATSLDSAAFAIAGAASKDLPVEAQPPRWHRLVWALVLGVTALVLMYLGGLPVLQAASVVVGLPLLGVMSMMIWSLMRQLNARPH
jgi:BCCT family betaine/carnitine transporter